jgi:hypothetical protein
MCCCLLQIRNVSMKLRTRKVRAIEPIQVGAIYTTIVLSYAQFTPQLLNSVTNATVLPELVHFSNSTTEFLHLYAHTMPNTPAYLFSIIPFPISASVYFTCVSFYSTILRVLNTEMNELNEYCKNWMKNKEKSVSNLYDICAWHERISYSICCANNTFSTFVGIGVCVKIPLTVLLLYLLCRSEDLLLAAGCYGTILVMTLYTLIRLLYESMKLHDNVRVCYFVCYFSCTFLDP